jgi:predicted alpha-1,2-mannosidase
MRPWLACCLIGCTAAEVVEPPLDPDDVPFPIEERPLTQHVDPFIGSRGPGNVIPGALVPHGMVRASPDTLGPAGTIDAYDGDDERIEGFTHTHLEGPGGSLNGYSQVLFLPQTGPLVIDRNERAARYDHDREEARPGYYSVDLIDHDVTVELTATGHAAVHRIQFPAGPARLLIDLGHSNGTSTGGALSLDGSIVSGSGEYNVHPIAAMVTGNDGRTAYTEVFVWAEASLAPTETGTITGQRPTAHPGQTSAQGPWTAGWIGWELEQPTTIELRVGISYLDVEQARHNAEVELGESTFDQIAAAADATWNTALNRVQVTADPDTLVQFYTALYHNAFQPADHTEPGGVFMVGDSGERVRRDDPGLRFMTSDWCLWDTYRTSHPLRTLIEPDLYDDVVTSLLVMYEEGGWIPKCTWAATGNSRVMIGNHAIPVIADGMAKGLDHFDHALAWEAVDKAGTQEMEPLPDGLCGYINVGTPPDYIELGYVPTECDPSQAASMTIEHSQDDHATAVIAGLLGRTADQARYAARASNWKNHWDVSTGFMRGRHRDGTWVEPFDPADRSDFNDFVEASSWIFSFHVPHDLPALIELYGGDVPFRERLDRFFAEGHFDPSNQPSFHVPWLYAHAGDPAATQARVREIVQTHYHTGPHGLPGNDDAGSTSAWLVFSMLGLYPVSPGDPVYTLSSPLVREAVVHLHPGHYDGGALTVRTVGDPLTEPYLASVTLNGEALVEPFVTHAQLVGGGELVFTLSATPTSWGQ